MQRACEIHAVDLFCGAGGLTKGLSDAGINVVAGIDSDPLCEYPYETNNPSKFIHADISRIRVDDVKKLYPRSGVRLLAGCAPCQPYSALGRTAPRKRNPDRELLLHFARLVRRILPDLVVMENVTNIKTRKEYSVFVSTLKKLQYEVDIREVDAHDYGVPQSRKRIVLLASLLGPISLSHAEHRPNSRPFVQDAIGHWLEALSAGESSSKDPLHRSKRLRPLNLTRIRASKPGGTWRDWPKKLRLPCHKKASGRKYVGVYGRMSWAKPAPTITTEFGNLGSGRFGHPAQDRAITPREAALLQTFPFDYDFLQPDLPFSHERVSKWIGNAVPVKLAEAIGLSLRRHADENS